MLGTKCLAEILSEYEQTVHWNNSVIYEGMCLESMVRRGSVCSASACCKAGPSSILGSAPQGGFIPLSLPSDEEMERGPGEWRRISGLYECDMNVIE